MKLCTAVFIALAASCAYAQESLPYKVLEIVDAETVELLSSRGVKSTMRIAGIDAPEIDQPFAKESVEQLATLIKGKEVTVQLIKIGGDRRMVSKIRLNGTDVGLTLIRTGYSWYKDERGELAPNDAKEYADAQAEAKNKKLGLWATDAIEPKEWRKTAAAKSLSNTVPKETYVGIVDTNYYYPFHCDEARFDPDEVQKTFTSEADAVKAGFRKGTTCSKPRPVATSTFGAETTQRPQSARATRIIEMTSDFSAFSNKVVTVAGEVSMSTRFIGPFYEKDELFYSFEIADGTDSILAYTAKNSAAARLRQYLLQSGDATVWAKVRVQILGRTVGGTVFGSLISYESRR